MEKSAYIPAGRIVNTHGVLGEVKIEVWLDSPQFLRRCGRVFLDGRERKILSGRAQKQFLLAKLEGVEDLNTAMALKGREVQIARADAPLPRGGFFLQDILGARVVDEEGRPVGVLTEVLERPASNVYVVQGETEHLIPAVPAFVLATDVEAGVVTVRLIEGM
ncbi:MAG: 16S rRNA processing protein RimM [Oscillospiraceae bacterium]|nr:16S rRNA processing protein RimM [Oscillospiraceae bacterium]